MKKLIAVLILGFFIGSCGKPAKSDGTHAEVIPAPMTGYTCFMIVDGDGKSVGGNCVKE